MKLGIASGIACALLLGAGSAYGWTNHSAATDTSGPLASIRADMKTCGKLPASYRGICKAQVNREVDAQYASIPVAVVVIEPEFVEPTRMAFDTEASRYQRLMSECHLAPVSERDSCVDAASMDTARPAQLG